MSGAAGQLHLSQPALSRSMQKLEEELQVTLFDRKKNKIALNQNGELAVQQARRVMQQARDLVEQVRALDRSRHTISIGSCAPAPLWRLVPLVSQLYPEMTVSSEMKDTDVLLEGLKKRRISVYCPSLRMGWAGILVFPLKKKSFIFRCRPHTRFPARRGSILRILTGRAFCCFPK